MGQALTDHADVRKIGFTGSTDVGKGIMKRYISIITVNNHLPYSFLIAQFIFRSAVLLAMPSVCLLSWGGSPH